MLIMPRLIRQKALVVHIFLLSATCFILYSSRTSRPQEQLTCREEHTASQPNTTALRIAIRAMLKKQDQASSVISPKEETDTLSPVTTESNLATEENMAESELFMSMMSESVSYNSTTVERIVASISVFPPDEYLVKNESFFAPREFVLNNFSPGWLNQPSPCPTEGPFLLVIIPSLDGHTVQRRAIRETWASPSYGSLWPGHAQPWSNKAVKIVFFLSVTSKRYQKLVAAESRKYKDIVRVNFSESYHNLSLKMANVLRWVASFCARARHVLKVDEDTFVNIPLLLYVLKLFSTKHSRFVLGHRHNFKYPPVVRYGKWQVGEDIYPFTAFPRYLFGHSYLISGDAIKPLFRVSQHMPVVPNEDAYVTGILAKSAKLSRFHSSRFAKPATRAHHKLERVDRCDLVRGIDISQTGFKNTTSIYSLWNMFKAKNCSNPT